jgi:hypothetical protein
MLLRLCNPLKAAEDIPSNARTGVHTNMQNTQTLKCTLNTHITMMIYCDACTVCMYEPCTVWTMHSTNPSHYEQQICMFVYKHEPFAVWTVKGQQEIVAPRSTSTSEVIMVSSFCEINGCFLFSLCEINGSVLIKDSLYLCKRVAHWQVRMLLCVIRSLICT